MTRMPRRLDNSILPTTGILFHARYPDADSYCPRRCYSGSGDLRAIPPSASVVGELVGGILVGQHMLGWVHGDSSEIRLLADIGAILLLFEAGLESDLDGLLKVGFAALCIGCCGVMLHMAITLPVARYLGIHGLATYYVSGALAATSVGISARVFGDLKALQFPEARMVMGAAVIDDVIGLVILAVLNRIGIGGGQVTPTDALLTVAIAILLRLFTP